MASSQFEFPNEKLPWSKSKSSPTDWFELYYCYLEGCREFNQGSLPEKGWEKHHILPQCLFGENTPTVWLSYDQHCVASGYQTLAFDTCCFFGEHLQRMPEWMKPLVKAIRKRMLRKNGSKVGSLPKTEFQRQTSRVTGGVTGKGNVEHSRGIWNPDYDIEKRAWCRKGGEAVAPLIREKYGVKIVAIVNGEETLFPSLGEASRVTGASAANIRKVCKGKRRHTLGIVFRYLE